MRYDRKQRDPFYGSAVWLGVRRMALERDHYWCCRCGVRPANTVHHLLTREERPDLELELDNLESLCSRCHNQLHPERNAKAREASDAGGVRVVRIK